MSVIVQNPAYRPSGRICECGHDADWHPDWEPWDSSCRVPDTVNPCDCVQLAVRS